jgi:HlyD family secretion protein
MFSNLDEISLFYIINFSFVQCHQPGFDAPSSPHIATLSPQFLHNHGVSSPPSITIDKRSKNMFKNRRNVWIFVGVLVVVIVAAGLVFLSLRSQGTAAAAYQTTTVQLGTLTSSVEGSGAVASALTSNLTWQTSGQVDKVNTQIGAQVKTGDVLASLLQSSTSVATLQTNLLNAQANLAQLTSPGAIAAAQSAVAADQTTLTNAQIGVSNLTYHNQSAIANAAASVTLTQVNLKNAQTNYNSINLPATDPQKANAYQQLYGAQQRYNSAVNTYNNLTGHPSQASIDAANAALAQAQANLAQDQNYLAALTGGTVPAGATGASLLKLEQAQLAVQTAQQALNTADVIAPFNGTITQSNAIPGQSVSPSTVAFRIDDLTNLVVTIQVVQIDVNSVKVGQPATIVFDAIPNKTYNGKVIKVDLAGTSSSSTVNFNVAVQLTDADAQVKPGMTANVTLTTNQVTGALLIPSTSIFTDTNGQNYVYLIQNGTTTAVPVTVGATSASSSQITGSTLKQGDTIVLSFASTSSSSSSARGFGLGGIGGGDVVGGDGGGTRAIATP